MSKTLFRFFWFGIALALLGCLTVLVVMLTHNKAYHQLVAIMAWGGYLCVVMVMCTGAILHTIKNKGNKDEPETKG